MDRLNLQEKASERGTASRLLRIPSSFFAVEGFWWFRFFQEPWSSRASSSSKGWWRAVEQWTSKWACKTSKDVLPTFKVVLPDFWWMDYGFISFSGVAHGTKFAVSTSTWQVPDTLSVLQTEPTVRIEWGCIGGWMKADGSTGCSSHSTLILCNIRVTNLEIEKISVFLEWMLS